jgi:Zn-dependent protease
VPVAAATLVCRRCGTEAPSTRAVCPACATPFADVPATPSETEAAQAPSWTRRAGPLGAVGLVLWKLKTLLLLVVPKLGTAATMFASFSLYAFRYGWRYGLGLVLSIYVHELGHVVAMRRRGIAASAPMFIPGFGAIIRMVGYPKTPADDARVGLAGPWFGLGAAVACALIWQITGAPVFAALARSGAFINLLNLTPVWQLDGARGFRALSRAQRWLIAILCAGSVAISGEKFFLVLVGAAVVRAFGNDAPAEGDRGACRQFVFLVVALTALLRIPVTP